MAAEETPPPVEEEVVTPEEEQDDSADEPEEKPEPLGEAGIKALRKERDARKAAEKALKAVQIENEDEQATALREAQEVTAEKYRGVIARSAFRAALAEAGLRKGQDKMLRLLTLEDVVVDDDGSTSGVVEQVAELKSEFPELFGRSHVAGGMGDGGARGERTDGKPKSSAERMAAAARGQ